VSFNNDLTPDWPRI